MIQGTEIIGRDSNRPARIDLFVMTVNVYFIYKVNFHLWNSPTSPFFPLFRVLSS